MLELANSRLYPLWSHLTEGLRTGLPQVAPIFKDYVSSHRLSDRLRFEPGDFFEREFPKADVALMGHILHDWDLSTKRMLIQKAFNALPDGGTLVVYEAIIIIEADRSQIFFDC